VVRAAKNESTAAMNDGGKSDWLIVPGKLPNNGSGWPLPAEEVEGSGQAKGNLERHNRVWTQRQTTRNYVANRCAQRALGYANARHAFAPEAGARCGNSARRDLCGGPPARAVPTATSHRLFEHTYDSVGRLTQLTDYDGTTLDYAYDAAGRVTSMNDYFSHATTYTYTDTGQVSTITAPGSKTWTYAYNVLGQATSVSIPNGMTTAYGYDTRNGLTKIEHKDGATVLDGFTYALDDGGNITTTTHADSSLWDYEYDGRDRLTKAERYDTDGTTLLHRYSYTYDAGDNLLTKAVYDGTNTTTTTFAYTDANEMTTSSVGGTTTTFGYDAFGRMTSKGDGTYTASYTYGPPGMLSTVTSDFPEEDDVTYATGGDGKRRSRTVNSTETWYNWAGASVINEENSNGTLSRTYFGQSSAHVDGTSPATGSYRYCFHDHIESVRRVRNDDKSSFAELEYDPYGAQYASSGSASSVSRRYATLEWDVASGAYFAPYRYFRPSVARWTSRDPLGMVDGPNLYGYVGQRPTMGVDPLGLRIMPDGPIGPNGPVYMPQYQGHTVWFCRTTVSSSAIMDHAFVIFEWPDGTWKEGGGWNVNHEAGNPAWSSACGEGCIKSQNYPPPTASHYTPGSSDCVGLVVSDVQFSAAYAELNAWRHRKWTYVAGCRDCNMVQRKVLEALCAAHHANAYNKL
jgi:RHS repeat-associated protein